MKTALLIIDIQKDYFPGGKYPLVEPLAAAQKAYMLLQCFREHSPLGAHHVHIQHISLEPDATFFIKGDSGSDIHDSVAHFEGEPIVYAPTQTYLPPPQFFGVLLIPILCQQRGLLIIPSAKAEKLRKVARLVSAEAVTSNVSHGC